MLGRQEHSRWAGVAAAGTVPMSMPRARGLPGGQGGAREGRQEVERGVRPLVREGRQERHREAAWRWPLPLCARGSW